MAPRRPFAGLALGQSRRGLSLDGPQLHFLGAAGCWGRPGGRRRVGRDPKLEFSRPEEAPVLDFAAGEARLKMEGG